MISQHMNIMSKLLLMTSVTMANVNKAITAKKRLYLCSPIMYREEYT